MTKYSEAIKKQRQLHQERRKVRTEHRLLEDVPEINKWMAEDYIKQISVGFENEYKDIIRKYKDLEPLSNVILKLYKSIWNNGLEGVTEEMPEEQRRNIYNQKLKTWFWYECFNWIKNSEKRRNLENQHIRVDSDREQRYEGEKVKQNELADEKDLRKNWESALIEAIFEYFRHHKTMLVMSDKRNMRPPERQKLGIMAYSMFDMYYRKGLTFKEIGEKWNKSANNASVRNIKSIENLKKHLPEIIRLAEKIYDEKYEFS